MTAPLASKTNCPAKSLTSRGKFPVVVDGGVILQAVLHPDLVVLLAVARGDVDAAGPGVEGDEGGEDQQALPVDQRMAALEPLHDRAGKLVEDLVGFIAEAEGVQTVVEQILRQDQDLALDLHRHVEEILVEGDGQVRRDRPGGRRPDDDGDLLAGKLAETRSAISEMQAKLHVDRRRRVVLVFDLGLRQGRLAGGAPVDGLLPLVDAPVQVELAELRDGRRLVVVGHREIGIVPLAEDPETFELLALDPDILSA